MCGIAGRLASLPLSPGRRAVAMSRMTQRGPDGNGAFDAQRPDGQFLDLLHSRLSIIDLNTRSDQPFRKDGWVLIYNGEIYNYPELRVQLQQRGHRFETSGDTEVLVEAWRAWGLGALDRLVGMFAFAIYQEDTGTLTLARDRFGEKPLYLWDRGPDGLFFASEIKVLTALAGAVPAIDGLHMQRYLVNGYKGLMKDHRTFFAEVREVPAAHALVIKAG